nr:ATP-binding cassette domain-containing protein [Nocardioides alcanivorans]
MPAEQETMSTTSPSETSGAASLSTAPQTAGGAKPDPILVADDVVRTFGGLTAVDVQHVEIQRNTITALIGPNGAGKTTFFNLLTGFDKADSGSWQFDGQDISRLAPTRWHARGWSAPSS